MVNAILEEFAGFVLKGVVILIIIVVGLSVVVGYFLNYDKEEEIRTTERIEPIRMELQVIDGKEIDTIYVYKKY